MAELSWTEPESAANTDYQPQYPYNNITQTESGHAFEGDDRDPSRKLDLKTIWVGYPGEEVTFNSKRIKAAKIIKPENYKPRTFFSGGRTITRENDFAVVVLEEPLPLNDKPVELLTPDLFAQYLANLVGCTCPNTIPP